MTRRLFSLQKARPRPQLMFCLQPQAWISYRQYISYPARCVYYSHFKILKRNIQNDPSFLGQRSLTGEVRETLLTHSTYLFETKLSNHLKLSPVRTELYPAST